MIDFGLILKKEMDALKVECTGPDKSDLEFLLRHFGLER